MGIGISAVELVGVAIAAIVLLITFGSLVAAGTPLIAAAVGVGTGMLGILAAASITDINSTTPVLAVMIGLAVGIDYALFIVSRAREYLADGVRSGRGRQGGPPPPPEGPSSSPAPRSSWPCAV